MPENEAGTICQPGAAAGPGLASGAETECQGFFSFSPWQTAPVGCEGVASGGAAATEDLSRLPSKGRQQKEAGGPPSFRR